MAALSAADGGGPAGDRRSHRGEVIVTDDRQSSLRPRWLLGLPTGLITRLLVSAALAVLVLLTLAVLVLRAALAALAILVLLALVLLALAVVAGILLALAVLVLRSALARLVLLA